MRSYELPNSSIHCLLFSCQKLQVIIVSNLKFYSILIIVIAVNGWWWRWTYSIPSKVATYDRDNKDKEDNGYYVTNGKQEHYSFLRQISIFLNFWLIVCKVGLIISHYKCGHFWCNDFHFGVSILTAVDQLIKYNWCWES